MPFQHNAFTEPIFKYFEESSGNAFISAVAGSGKCLAPGTKVLMYDGSVKKIEDIQQGEQVMGWDSSPRTVLSLATGTDMMYQVIPKKGDTFTVNSAHILTVFDSTQKKVVDISLEDYFKKSVDWKRKRATLIRVPTSYPEQPLPVDPYWFGIWLGDGSAYEPVVTTPDQEIWDACRVIAEDSNAMMNTVYQSGPRIDGFSIRTVRGQPNPFKTVAKEAMVDGEKRILPEYLINSEHNRLQLLAGIIDSDGHLSHNCYEVITKHKGLRDDILYLARSLGFAAYAKRKRGEIKSLGFVGYYWRIIISGHTDRIPCKVERKKAAPRRQVKDVLRVGFKVEPWGEGSYYGFELDGDGRFVLGDFTVTHNTTTLLEMMNHFSTHPDRFSEHMQKGKFLFVAFSKAIQKELQSRVPESERQRFQFQIYVPIQDAANKANLMTLTQSAHDHNRAIMQNWSNQMPRQGDVRKYLEKAIELMAEKPIDTDYGAVLEQLDGVLSEMSTMEIRTFHSLGRQILADHFEAAEIKIDLDNDKYHKLVREFLKTKNLNREDYTDALSVLKKLLEQARLSLTDAKDVDTLEHLAIRFEVDLGPNKLSLMNKILQWVAPLMNMGEEQARSNGKIDFTDMVYLPVHWDLKPETPFDIIFVDEAQDLSEVTRTLVYKQALAKNGRIFFVGDASQAIFGFAGSDSQSVETSIKLSNAEKFPLSVCYRCPTSHIDVAQRLVPHIEPRPGASKGDLFFTNKEDFPHYVKPNDLVLCRLTAPLIARAIELIKMKIPATVKGREIGNSLVSVLRKLEKQADKKGGFYFDELPELIDQWADREVAHLIKREANESAITAVYDKREALHVCYNDFGATNLDELVDEIKSLFNKNRASVTFSTVHRAKGLEAERVFIIVPEKMPLRWKGQAPWQYQQELNILYVALTRSKNFLCIVGDKDVWLDNLGVVQATGELPPLEGKKSPARASNDDLKSNTPTTNSLLKTSDSAQPISSDLSSVASLNDNNLMTVVAENGVKITIDLNTGEVVSKG